MSSASAQAFLAVLTHKVAIIAFEAIKNNGLDGRFDVLSVIALVFFVWTYLAKVYVSYVAYVEKRAPGWVELVRRISALVTYLFGFLAATYLADIINVALPLLNLGIVELLVLIVVLLLLVFGGTVFVETYTTLDFRDLNHRHSHMHGEP